MSDAASLEDLKEAGAGVPAPEPVATLYRRAFAEFGLRALWSRRPGAHPTIAQALVVAGSLRREGDMSARPLAARIEEACRAAVANSN